MEERKLGQCSATDGDGRPCVLITHHATAHAANRAGDWTPPVELVNQKWDRATGTRERLALLAAVGPTLDPACWLYNTHHDRWRYSGGARERQGYTLVSNIEPASVSLIALQERWNISKDRALDLIWAEGEDLRHAAAKGR